MNYSSCLRLAVWAAVVVLLGEAVLFAEHKCCQSTQSYAPCVGCVQVCDDPLEYVQAGTNTVSKCQSTLQTMDCSELQETCFSLEAEPLYGESGCSTQIGTVTLERRVGQCDIGEGACGGAG